MCLRRIGMAEVTSKARIPREVWSDNGQHAGLHIDYYRKSKAQVMRKADVLEDDVMWRELDMRSVEWFRARLAWLEGLMLGGNGPGGRGRPRVGFRGRGRIPSEIRAVKLGPRRAASACVPPGRAISTPGVEKATRAVDRRF